MELSIAEQFVLIALNPVKGRITVDNIHFRYSLTGAILMDYLEGDEFRVENKRVVPLLKLNDDSIHRLFTEQITKSARNRKISYWVRRLTNKSRFIFSEMIKKLEKQRLIRIEQKRFLNIIPYKRYWLSDNSSRDKLIENLRSILLRGRQTSNRDMMLLGIIEASRAYQQLSKERGETAELRRKNRELLKGNVMSDEISQAIREVQAAIIASVTAASVAAHGSH